MPPRHLYIKWNIMLFTRNKEKKYSEKGSRCWRKGNVREYVALSFIGTWNQTKMFTESNLTIKMYEHSNTFVEIVPIALSFIGTWNQTKMFTESNLKIKMYEHSNTFVEIVPV